MHASDIAIVIAVLLGPILAVQAQKRVESLREMKKRKEYIFRTLMATRASRVSTEHVQSLNMIDFEFYAGGDKEREVREAWNEYRDHLNTPYTPEALLIWQAKGDGLFYELLYKMSLCVDLKFERPQIKNSAYSPVAHGNLEQDQNTIRAGLVALFSKKFAIPVATFPATKEESDEQAALRKLVAEGLSGQRPYKVEIVNSGAIAKRAEAGTEHTKDPTPR